MATRELALTTTKLLSIEDLSYDELQGCLHLAAELKAARAARLPHGQPLAGRHYALYSRCFSREQDSYRQD